MSRLVLTLFPDEAAADTAAAHLDRWASNEANETMVDDLRWQAMGVLVLDANGQVKTHKLGPRHVLAGAGIGLVLGAIAPVLAVPAMVAGGIAGGLYREGLHLSHADVDRLRCELQGGKAAIGVLTDASREAAISAKLVELGGAPEAHEVDVDAIAAADTPPAPDGTGQPGQTLR